MTPSHVLSTTTLDRLAEGKPDPDAIRALGAAQISKRLLLVKYLVETWPADPAVRDRAVAVLADTQQRDPGALTSLLAEPHTGVWAAETVRRLRGADPPAAPMDVNTGYLGALALAGATHTGIEAEFVVHARRGLAAIPSLGAARVPVPDGTPVHVTVKGGALRFAGPHGDVEVPDDPTIVAPGWLPLRRLSADADGQPLTVALDDIDPFRHAYHIPAADRLSGAEVARWQELLEGAWRLLTSRAPGTASEIAAGLRTMVPLAASDSGPARSATVRDAFGSFGLTPPDNSEELAIAMVHEFQHSKLSALLDLVALHEPADTETYFAPWRSDPRPIGGLFQGVFAFLAIADLWCALRAEPALRSAAERGLARIREQVRAGLDELSASGRLTPAGERFTAGMRTRLDALFAVSVPTEVSTEAREALRRDHQEWRRRNARSD